MEGNDDPFIGIRVGSMRFYLFNDVLVRDFSCQCWLASCCVSGQSEFALPVIELDHTKIC